MEHIMQLRLHHSATEAAPSGDFAERCVRDATRRRRWLTRRAKLRFDDSQFGAVNKRCRLEFG